ncbi:MAG: MFS transporter [Candidatus Eisenbacteria bacterium]|nr:MFS transporter [Candidatus Eisenbacteria bacterium]
MSDGVLPRWRAFPALALGVVMATLDISVVNIALPTLSRTFGVPLTRIEWVVLGYVLTITGLLLTVGRIADGVGRRRVYGMGLGVFCVASALCGVAPAASALIAARVLQGVGAAMMAANTGALLVSSFPAEERGRALGAFGAAVGVGLAIGTPLGGLVIAHASWRWLFFINLPLGAVAMWLLWTRVTPDRDPPRRVRLDLGAAAAWCAALVALMLALARGPESGWSSASVWPLYLVALAALALFAWFEHRALEPLMPLRLLQGPLGLTVLLTMIGQALTISVGFHLPLYLEEVAGFGAADSGKWLATLPVSALFAAPIAGRLADRLGTRPVATSGMALTIVGFVLLAGLGTIHEAARLFAGLALIGAGQGLFSVPNASALLSLVPPELLGFASGLQGTMRNLGIAGGSAGTAALVASVYVRLAGHALRAGGAGTDRAAFAAATREAFLALALLATLGTALSWARRGSRGGAPEAGQPG